MNDFLKVAWLNDTDKNYWKEKIQTFQSIYEKLELDSVGVSRQAAIITVDPLDLPELSKKVADKGWWMHVTSAISADTDYHNRARKVTRTEQIRYRVLVSVKHFTAYDDDYTVGRYLGYPYCCIHDFTSWWGQVDDHTPRLYQKEKRASLASTHFRQLGIRFVRHLPCNPACSFSAELADIAYYNLLEKEPSTVLAIRKFILQEAEFTRLHGVAEIITPVVKFAYNTDYTKSKESFTIIGDKMVRFNEREYKDNGFSSMHAMDRAHDPIILNFLYIMRNVRNPNPKIIDYGCGNGALLEKLQTLSPNVNVAGIDLNDSALRNAEQRLPTGQFHLGNLFTRTIAGPYDIGMVSIKRLHESPELALMFIEYEKNHSQFTILYDYDNGGSVEEQLRQYYPNFKVYHTYKNNACEALTVRW